jgi:hypothetical protein
MPEREAIEIRSYRVCFDLERRVHKIDRWRVPLPYGVPLRGLAYGGAGLLLVLFAARLPLVGQLLAALHPALRLGGLPVGAAALLLRWNPDGRTAHRAILASLRLWLAPRRLIGFRSLAPPGATLLGDVAVAADERSCRLRKGVVRGPARVVLRYPVRGRGRGRTLRLEQAGGDPQWRGTEVELRQRQRLVVR